MNDTRLEKFDCIVDIMKDELQRVIQRGQFADERQTTSQRAHLILYSDRTDLVTKERVQKEVKA